MPVRRYTDPIHIKLIWDAIRSAQHAKQTTDLARIIKYIQNLKHYSSALIEGFVKNALKDKLITATSRKSDGSSTIYKIVEQELPELDGKDWYCFECHLASDVVPCGRCFRVFHAGCVPRVRRQFDMEKMINCESQQRAAANEKLVTSSEQLEQRTTFTNEDRRSVQYDESLCFLCNLSNVDYSCGMEKSEINYMLRFVLHRIRAWLPNTITHTMAEEDRPEWLTDTELTWRANQLFFEHRDMSVMEVKINTETYTTFSEFLADVYSVQHNVAIFHGVESQEYGAAELMVRDANHDINEMKTCVDCYKHSNEKLNAKWFCLPCRIPHKLVWAKQKGYPYWPAKVIKETATHCDVRFFGGKYERALLVKSLIKPIGVSIDSLQIKASAAFNKANEELQLHQSILNNPHELEKLKAQSKSPRKQKPLLNISSESPRQAKKRGRPPSTNKTAEKRKSSVVIECDTEDKRPKQAEPVGGVAAEPNSTQESSNVIDISDAEEEETQEYSFRDAVLMSLDETCEPVTSSTENFGKRFSPRRETDLHVLDQPYSDSVEKMRRKLEQLPNKADIIKCAMECMQNEIDKITKEHNDHLKNLFESHNQQISETKKKQWCYNCEQDAIYHCCWNTAYCSQTCQQHHWQSEHKKVCRRKR